ncbi:MAG: phenylalanine--tRNA ligase subunit beta [Leptolinea sp.]|jgi:phenylalanyl-tRNA synthetase beta chain|nr:phenylalanine--tRNA ligase subunit beta [Leptolinea sp.]
MKVPLSWLKDYVDIDLPLDQLARLLTMAGLEVDEIRTVGLPIPHTDHNEFKFTGLEWDREKIVVAQIDEVMPHPNADRLVLCKLKDGQAEHVVLTGAPNLYPYKGQGPLSQPIKVAYAKEGAVLYDGHAAGLELTTLKRAKIRGVESYSMVCSEKELGISEEHEGVIFLEPDAPTGMPLVDYIGDAVFDISILPNMIRNACVLGVAREVAAITGKPLRKPVPSRKPTAASIKGRVFIKITEPKLNPRFAVGMVSGCKRADSPYWVQRRLRLAGMRPISALVDATNYVMLELGEPLHAFDYDVLVKRVNGGVPTIITRTAAKGEKLTTLDNVERELNDYTMLVCDTKGSLSIAGVMGGLESEITDSTTTVLLEGAAWNFINIRKTMSYLKLKSEASFRMSRGVHPGLCDEALWLCLSRMAEWSGGEIHCDLVDEYPLPPNDPVVTITPNDVTRWLGIDLTVEQIASLLTPLDFTCKIKGNSVEVKTPPSRLDIGTTEGYVGEADVMEEIARMYGYDNIPATRLCDEMPPQRNNPALEKEELVRDLLAKFGLQEIMSYRLTTPEREARWLQPVNEAAPDLEYVTLQNPIAIDRRVMRRSVTASVLEALERNIRLSDRLLLFEIGQIYLPRPNEILPEEPRRLVIGLTGKRETPAWDQKNTASLDFFDLKGIIEELGDSLHLAKTSFAPAQATGFHPGKCASWMCDNETLGVFGEIHPLVKERFDYLQSPVLVAEIDLETLLKVIPARISMEPVPSYPPVLEDLALTVDEAVPAGQVEALIQQTGGKHLVDIRLFDIFRSAQIGLGKKSLAYSLTYQSPERTLTDEEVALIRGRIVKRLEQELGARLRS